MVTIEFEIYYTTHLIFTIKNKSPYQSIIKSKTISNNK